MRMKRISTALIISLVLHLAIVFITGIYLITQTPRGRELINAEVLQLKVPPGPKVRKPIVKPAIKPTPRARNTAVEQIQLQPRVTTVFVEKFVFQPRTVLEIPKQTIKVKPPVDPNVPRVVTPNEPVPTVLTQANLTVSDAPDALAFSAPVVTAPSVRLANISRRVAGSSVQVKIAFEHPPGLAMVENVGART